MVTLFSVLLVTESCHSVMTLLRMSTTYQNLKVFRMVPNISWNNDCVFILEDVKKKLSKLRQEKSTRADDIGPRLL